MISIRPATSGDIEHVTGMWEALLSEQQGADPRFAPSADAKERYLNDLREWIEADNVRCVLIAEIEGALVGFGSAQLWWPPPVYEPVLETYLDELYVVPDARRRGVGSALLDEIKRWAAKQGSRRLRLGTIAANETGIGFWKSRGAKEFLVALLLDLEPEGR